MKKYLLLILCSLVIVTGCQNKNKSDETKSTSTSEKLTMIHPTATLEKDDTSSSTSSTTKVEIKTNIIPKTTDDGTKTRPVSKPPSTSINTTTKKISTTNSTKKATTSTTTTSSTISKKVTTTTKKVISGEEVYQSMMAKKGEYPNGMEWTNNNCYKWNGGIYSRGCGCVGFAFILSDAAFGTTKAKKTTDLNNIKVGDIVRIYNDTHSVIILEVHSDYYIVAEGNINSSIYWGRKIPKNELTSGASYVLTRY